MSYNYPYGGGWENTDQEGFVSGPWNSGNVPSEGYSFGDDPAVDGGVYNPQAASYNYNPQLSSSYVGANVAGGSYFGSAGPGYTGSLYNPNLPMQPMSHEDASASAGSFLEEEPPLLEELGINFDHIWKKTLAVLNPLVTSDPEIVQDTDLAGPLCFCLLFGASLLLVGKVHFGYIYGIILIGCVSMYFLLNLMSVTSVSLICIMSVLGYCMLPMVFLSFGSILISLQGIVGSILAIATILWCCISASKLFVLALGMSHQQILVAYPCALLYGVFALLTIF